MHISTNTVLGAAALCVLGVVGGVMNAQKAAAQGNAGPTVTIDPAQLPLRVTMTGSSVVSGNVAASQQGTWNVGTTDNNVTTAPVDHYVAGITSTLEPNNPVVGPIDVSRAKTARLVVTHSSCAPCGDVQVVVYSGFQMIDSFNVVTGFAPAPGTSVTRVYDVPGEKLSVRFANTSSGKSNAMFVSVYTRGN